MTTIIVTLTLLVPLIYNLCSLLKRFARYLSKSRFKIFL